MRPLLLDATSPLADLYPHTFKTDQNGKINDWEAVVLIPFVKAERIKQALAPILPTLDASAIARNRHGPRYPPRALVAARDVTLSGWWRVVAGAWRAVTGTASW